VIQGVRRDTALGAAWQRLVRQLLTESVLLAVLGGAAGLLVARAALFVVHTVNPGNIPRLDVITLDSQVLLFTLAVSILTGLIFGLAPAYRAARPDLNNALKAGGRNTQGEGGLGSSRWRLRSALVVAELALSLMLLVGAGLLVRSFVRIQQVTPGYLEFLRLGGRLRFMDLSPTLIHRVLRRLEVDSPDTPAAGGKLKPPDGQADGGEIASAAFSPALGKVAALAYVRTQFAEPGTALRLGDVNVLVL